MQPSLLSRGLRILTELFLQFLQKSYMIEVIDISRESVKKEVF